MRICDRCHAKATDQIIFQKDDEKIDVCESCREEARALLRTPKMIDPKTGKKR